MIYYVYSVNKNTGEKTYFTDTNDNKIEYSLGSAKEQVDLMRQHNSMNTTYSYDTAK